MNDGTMTEWETKRAAVLADRGMVGFDSWGALRAAERERRDALSFSSKVAERVRRGDS